MERKPLNRKTPLQRSEPLRPKEGQRRGHNSTLRAVSPKRKVVNDETRAARRRYVKSIWLCQCCMRREATDCHELTPGGSREAALHHRACWLAVCGADPATGHEGCHDFVQHAPLGLQLALKKRSDPDHYDRLKVLEIKRVAATAVTEEEVERWTELLSEVDHPERDRAVTDPGEPDLLELREAAESARRVADDSWRELITSYGMEQHDQCGNLASLSINAFVYAFPKLPTGLQMRLQHYLIASARETHARTLESAVQRRIGSKFRAAMERRRSK